MDAVKSFNAELSSLYEVKPPISKAKMTALTRGAIKAIKFYKHVVQSVEKFILKCKSEYKVPGLYVIDSIVRQSRHQFGADKDVFAPRFAKNMQQTFVNLFKCPPEDKSKVIRVLNLWQKNQVFAPDVIQPLFDLADPNHPIHKELSAAMANNGMQTQAKGSPALQKTPTKTPSTNDSAALAQLGNMSNNTTTLDSNTLAQLQQLHRILMRQGGDGGSKPEGQAVHFDRKLLDFDYGSDEEDDPTNPSPKLPANNSGLENVGSLLSNPEVIRQLQTLQQSMITNQSMHTDFDLEKLRKLQEMKQQEDEFDKHLAQTVPNLPFAAECEFKPSNTNSPGVLPSFFLPPGADLSQPPPGYKPSQPYEISQPDDNAMESEVEFIGANDNDVEVIDIDHGDSRSPSRDRYSRRRRSRSKDRSRDRRDRDRRSRRSRSRSRSRSRRHRSRSRDRDRERDKDKEKDREKEKERRKRGLPPIKKDNLSVCSTTLWVGHLSKLVHQEELSDTFGEFGEIVSIDLIIPRGCAFIVMHRRQDAARCLTKLKNHKMQGKAITLAWAPGKGVKGKELKDYWEGDLGVSYIPYSKLKPDIDIEMLEDGGMIDEDTMPPWMKEKMGQINPKKENSEPSSSSTTFVQMADVTPTVDTSQPPPVPTTGLLQPPPMTLPLVTPFHQLNNRLLGMPPGMMPNVPMGVPPPNLQPPLLPNQLLGISSPFGQGLLHPPPMTQMPPMDNKPSSADGMPPPMQEPMLPFGMLPPQPPPVTIPPPSHEDNMDVEMEDADKIEIKPSLSDQLLASMNSFNSGNNRHNRDDENRRNDRNRSRDRDRDRNRGRRGSRERRDSRDDRDSSSHSERRERNNRWSDRGDNRDDREERREREKALNDRLREMAGDNSFREEKEHPPPLLERPILFNNFEPPIDKPPAERFGRRRHEDFPPLDFEAPPARLDFEPPPLDFDGPEFEGPPRDFDVPNRDFEGPPRDFEGPPRDFEGPPIDFEMPPRDFEHPREFDFDGPPRPLLLRDGPGHMGRGDRFDDRRRGPPPDFFPPRDGFGMRPRFRGPGPDFGPRGRPMMRPPHMFHPRGPHMRGPRPGPWMDGMRPPNFQPRFDGPPEFFRGPPGEPPNHRRHDDRRRFRPEFEQEQPPQEFDRPERRSRWGNNSPRNENDQVEGKESEQQKQQLEENGEPSVEQGPPKNEPEEKRETTGNTTPLHDEPQENTAHKNNNAVEESNVSETANEEQS